jgi:hypothetical protein
MPNGTRKASGQAFQVGKNAIAPLVLEPGKSVRETHSVIHENLPRAASIGTLAGYF